MNKVLRTLIIDKSGELAHLVGNQSRKSHIDILPETVGTVSGLVDKLSAQAWDIIISGYEMPSRQAARALQLSKEHAPETPFIYISKQENEAATVEALHSGAYDFISIANISRLGDSIKRAALHGGKETEPAKKAKKVSESQVSAAAAPLYDKNNNSRSSLSILTDVTTGQKKSLRERDYFMSQIEAERRLLEIIVENAPSAILLLSGQELKIELVNPVYQMIAPGKDMIGKTFDQVWPEIYPEIFPIFSKVLETGEPHFAENQRFFISRSTGSELEEAYFNWSVIRVRLPGKNKWGLLNTAIETTKRVIMEKSLRESEEHFRTLADNISQFAWMADQSGYIFWYNKRWYDYTGTDLEQMRGWGWQKVHHPDYVERVTEKFRKFLIKGTAWEDTFPIRGKDGQYRWFLSRAIPIRDDNGNVVLWFGTNTDVTELRISGETLRYREFIQAQAARMAHLGAWDIIVSKNGDIQASPLHWSEEVYRIFGYEPGEVEVSNELFYEHVHPDDRKKVFDTFDKAIASRKPYEIEHRIVRKDGTERMVLEYGEAQFDEDGNLRGIVGAVQDITERKQWEEQLKESSQLLKQSEERFRLALKYSPVAVFTQDRNLIYTWIYQSVMELPDNYFIGKTDADIFIKEDAAKIKEIKSRVIETGQSWRDKISVSIYGKEAHFDMSVEPLINEAGEIEGIACAAINITDMVQLEAEKNKQEVAQVIERSARLASIGVIAGGITHEINQPLNAIRMGAGGILFWNKRNNNVLPEVLVEMMTGINDAVTRIDEIVKSMRALWANTGKETLEDVNINDSIEKVVSFNTQKLRNHGITVKVDLHPEKLLIHVNGLRLELVLSNLLTNAIQALDESSNQKKILEISSGKDGRKAIIEIGDNGPGLPDVPIDKLFDPFFTTKGPEEGSGLGLAIVKMFLDKYGAALEVFNNESGGATFRMTFNMIKQKQM